MPLISGTDDLGKIHWLQESGYWGERVSAKNWSPHEATQRFQEINMRNRALKPQDRIEPELFR